MQTYKALGLNSLPSKCEKCGDIEQNRPDITLSRETLYETDVIIDKSMAEMLDSFAVFQPRTYDKPVNRLTIKGAHWGADWSGRLDIYSHLPSLAVGDTVKLVYAKSRKQAWVRDEQRTVGGMTLNAREVNITRRCLPSDEGAREVVEENIYLVLLPSEAKAQNYLCFMRAETKTTLKGLGNQYYSELIAEPIWSCMFRGSCRSGRKSTTAMLAVLDPKLPAKVKTTGDVKSTAQYPMSLVPEPELL